MLKTYSGLSLYRYDKMYLHNHLTTQYFRASPFLDLSAVMRNIFIYRTSKIAKYSDILLSRSDVEIYVPKNLTHTICSGLSFSFSVSFITTYKIHVQKLNSNNIFYSFSLSFSPRLSRGT